MSTSTTVFSNKPGPLTIATIFTFLMKYLYLLYGWALRIKYPKANLYTGLRLALSKPVCYMPKMIISLFEVKKIKESQNKLKQI